MLWSIILAGGEGTRLRPLVQRNPRDGRPKQFAVLVGLALAAPTDARPLGDAGAARSGTVAVATRSHAAFFTGAAWGENPPHVLVQPSDRGTAAGVLLPVHRIARIDPGATVLVFPSDHYVGDDEAFMAHAEKMAAAAARNPARILLAGALPDGPETGYGWIEPGPAIERLPVGELRAIRHFVEKPSEEDGARADGSAAGSGTPSSWRRASTRSSTRGAARCRSSTNGWR
jgi:mannose-1-phosphate guanylyltransferase